MTARRPATRRLAAIALAAIGLAGPAARAQVGPAESARQLKPADGLEATLWAAEPMVVNPTTIDVDSRGRVWVTEGLNYRLTRGGNKQFSRVDEADAIKILSDTDGDGKADDVKVFADRIFPVPMGIAVEENWSKEGKYLGARVYVGNSPNLLVLEDTDGDDKADNRYPLLTGFGGIDSDHGVHGMVLGLDGKLYFTHGDGCCSVQPDMSERTQNFDVTDASGRRVSSDQLANTLRVNRDGTEFEVLADRQRNNYETTLNSFGNVFTSDNDDDGNRGSRVIWVMEGGRYGYRTPGSPRHWGEEVPGNVPKLVGTGNGSPCGVMVYEGSLMPEAYQGAVLEAEAGPRVINAFPLTRKGAAFRTEHNIMLASDDPWFRPVDVAAAPDGSLLVADWYDAGVGGHAFKDQTTGRIYRVAPKGVVSKAVAVDFASLPGLIEALRSPVVATRDVARRLLIERGAEARDALGKLYAEGTPVEQARALWVLHAIEGDELARWVLGGDPVSQIQQIAAKEPQLREQVVRILARDCRENGQVEYTKETARRQAPGARHLDLLSALATDPDAGVRREVILALRTLPTDPAGGLLKTLAASWDGQDRWYLEALGLALRGREPAFLAEVFDGKLYGPMDLDALSSTSNVALPPYFPVDRNEAFLAASDPDLPPANALSKTLGLLWQVHPGEGLPLLSRLLPKLRTAELQQAADDVLTQVTDPAGAEVLAKTLFEVDDPARRRQILAGLARRLDGPWREARNRPAVIQAIDAALRVPETKADALAVAAATGEGRWAGAAIEAARDAQAPVDLRVAAVEAIGRLKPAEARALLNGLIGASKEAGSSDPVAEAALRALPSLGESREALAGWVTDAALPLGLRREALRAAAQDEGGAAKLIELAERGELPEELKTVASTTLNLLSNRDLRDRAAKVLPLLGKAGGRKLPPFYDLVRMDGDPARGREAFTKAQANACGTCHRVQGRGQWVGPDLSTIGSKYGKGELLRSILSPSEAIGYNYRTAVLAMADGRVLTGLAVEDTPDRIVLKTADGQRLIVRPGDVDERKTADVSLMPEGLAEAMTDQDIADMLAFLATLKQPVSIVGEYQAVGPLAESAGKPAIDPAAKPDPSAPIRGGDGKPVAWRRLRADAEGRIDLSSLGGTDPASAIYLHTPIAAPADLKARLVVEAPGAVAAWLDGRPVDLAAPSGDDPARTAAIDLGRGPHDLLIRLPGGPGGSLVTTLVADQPLEFRAAEGTKVSAR